jgi:magnesium transporter
MITSSYQTSEEPSALNNTESALDHAQRLEIIEKLLDEGRLLEVKENIKGHPADIAELIKNLNPSRRILIFRLLPKDATVEVFEFLDVEEQSELLRGFTDERILSMVNEMSPDDRARLFDELPAKVVKRLLKGMTREEWSATSVLLGFNEDTAGRIMTPEYVHLQDNMTVKDALKRIRRTGHAKETIYYLYVTTESRRLIGVVSLRKLVLSHSKQLIRDIMSPEVIRVSTEDDQEKVAEIIRDYDLLAVPVVDKEGRLVGIVTVDDIVDVIEEEATEDMLRMGAVETADKSYFKSSIFNNLSKRIGWLIFLLALNTITGHIIISKKELLEGVVILSAFIPILTGSGGNTGTQSSTVVIRALAIGEITSKDAFRIILRELSVGIGIGLLLGSVATVWAFFLQHSWDVAIVVGLSLVFIATLATTLGTALPILVKVLGLDPAFIATPFITTAIDVGALFIYFTIAQKIMGL